MSSTCACGVLRSVADTRDARVSATLRTSRDDDYYTRGEVYSQSLTGDEGELEVVARWVLVTARSVARQPELERRTVGGSVAVDGTDRDD